VIVHERAPLGPRTTYRVGGAARLLVEVDDEADLVAASELVRGEGADVLVVGKGSNLLVADGGFDGIAVILGDAFADVDIDGTTVRAGGAAAMPVVARRSAAAGLTGLEWMVGVPGSIGGGVRMNAGGHGSDIAAHLVRIRRFDLATGDDGVVPAASLDLGYRCSAVRPSEVVVWAELAAEPGDPDAATATIGEIVRWRRDNQPGGQNAGSVFRNPPGDSAGRLIEAAGAKGLRIGTAEVSTKHANFIQADDGGRADDVRSLILEVQRRVRDHAGVELHPENLLVGFGDPRPEVEA
jgi:UDP-N-acetylmuramate dehydrogenase